MRGREGAAERGAPDVKSSPVGLARAGKRARPRTAFGGTPRDRDELSLELFERARSTGDPEAWEQLIAFNAPWLRAFLATRTRRFPGADVEALLEEVFFRVFRSARSFRRTHARSFVGWLFVIADNVVREEMRASRRRRGVDLDDVVVFTDERDDPRCQVERHEEVERLRRSYWLLRALAASAIEGCPEPLRRVLVLRHRMGMGYREIAQVLGVTRGCVANRLHRARRFVVQRLESTLRRVVLRAEAERERSCGREAAG